MLRTPQRALRIDQLEAAEAGGDPGADQDARLTVIFAGLRADPLGAARQTLGYLQAGGAEAPFMALARHYTLERPTGYHDYKLSEAVFESVAYLPSPWRQRYLAANLPALRGPADQPNQVMARARALLCEYPAAPGASR
jgi:hypothetical protein